MMLTAAETDVLAPLHDAGATMLAQVEHWSAINSGSGNLSGLALMAEALSEAFAAFGNPELVAAAPSAAVTPAGEAVSEPRGQHFRLCVRPDAPVRLLLTGHMDTVYPADHPFQAVRNLGEGQVNGPGVADMKGGIAAMLAALGAIERAPAAERFGYTVLITSDEEIGSPSSAPLLRDEAANAHWGLTYEPSSLPDGTLAGARWGSGNFSAVVRGRAAHAGRNPEDGRNALAAAADLALRLERLTGPDLRVNPARIDGGGPTNVVPDRAVLRFNMRPRTPEAEAHARTLIAEAVRAVEAAREVRIELHGSFARPPKPLDATQRLIFDQVEAAARDLGQHYATRESGGVCDGNNLAACGLPVVDTLGVRGGAIHSDKEYLIVDSLAERARLSALLMLRLAGAPLPPGRA